MKSIWHATPTLHELNQLCEKSLIGHLGIRVVEIGSHFLIAEMPVDARTMQPLGFLHGGASAALAETTANLAAYFTVDRTRFVCVGLELNINHIRAVPGGTVQARAEPLHLGRTTQVWEIKLQKKEEAGLIAASRLTISVLEKR